MRESVPSARYSPVCNVLRQWKTSLILTYRVYRLYDIYIYIYIIIYFFTDDYRFYIYIYIIIYFFTDDYRFYIMFYIVKIMFYLYK